MKASGIGALALGISLLLWLTVPATAQPSSEHEIRTTIARWYEELAKQDDGRAYTVTAPGFIDASPHYDHIDNGSAALGPRIYTSLPARALQFDYRIVSIRADASFAKVQVDERGYFYAWAAQQTYESAAATTFVLERGEADARWRILAHQSGSVGLAPSQRTDPMPDLRELFYVTEGRDREPAADASEADRF